MSHSDELRAQVKNILELRAGWLDGEGEAFVQEALEWVLGILEPLPGLGVEAKPYLYPCSDGSVGPEWDLPNWNVSATFNLTVRYVVMVASSTNDDRVADAVFRGEEASAESVAKFFTGLVP